MQFLVGGRRYNDTVPWWLRCAAERFKNGTDEFDLVVGIEFYRPDTLDGCIRTANVHQLCPPVDEVRNGQQHGVAVNGHEFRRQVRINVCLCLR